MLPLIDLIRIKNTSIRIFESWKCWLNYVHVNAILGKEAIGYAENTPLSSLVVKAQTLNQFYDFTLNLCIVHQGNKTSRVTPGFLLANTLFGKNMKKMVSACWG